VVLRNCHQELLIAGREAEHSYSVRFDGTPGLETVGSDQYTRTVSRDNGALHFARGSSEGPTRELLPTASAGPSRAMVAR
jgi:hypothetical protein